MKSFTKKHLRFKKNYALKNKFINFRMTIDNCIKTRYIEATNTKCGEKNRKFKLHDLSDYVILKGEKVCDIIGRTGKISDCIIFIKNNKNVTIVIVELKTRSVHTSEIAEKLNNASEIALEIIDGCSDITGYTFYHFVLHKGINTREYKRLIAEKLHIRGNIERILPKKCGTSFSSFIS